MADLLGIYLNDHLLGATGGLELFKRAAASQPEIEPLRQEVEQDREALLDLMRRTGTSVDRVKTTVGWVGEKLGRLKLNGHLLTRSPLSDLIELEGMTLGVSGKLNGWRLLKALGDPRLPDEVLDPLIVRAERQLEQLDARRLARGVEVLHTG